MSRTTSLDDDYLPEPWVQVTHYRPDFESLADDVENRLVKEFSGSFAGCLYLNPIVTIRCAIPSLAFFKTVRRFQAQWCRRAGQTFPRNVRRKVKAWVSGGEWLKNKPERFLDRALCFTGI